MSKKTSGLPTLQPTRFHYYITEFRTFPIIVPTVTIELRNIHLSLLTTKVLPRYLQQQHYFIHGKSAK